MTLKLPISKTKEKISQSKLIESMHYCMHKFLICKHEIICQVLQCVSIAKTLQLSPTIFFQNKVPTFVNPALVLTNTVELFAKPFHARQVILHHRIILHSLMKVPSRTSHSQPTPRTAVSACVYRVAEKSKPLSGIIINSY